MTVRRIRYLIGESLKLPVIIYTDHAIITSIVAKGILYFSNVDRLNIRLIRASQYLSQFELDVRYKLGRQHIFSDAILWRNGMCGLKDHDCKARMKARQGRERATRQQNNQTSEH
jgi:hypothetical protein